VTLVLEKELNYRFRDIRQHVIQDREGPHFSHVLDRAAQPEGLSFATIDLQNLIGGKLAALAQLGRDLGPGIETQPVATDETRPIFEIKPSSSFLDFLRVPRESHNMTHIQVDFMAADCADRTLDFLLRLPAIENVRTHLWVNALNTHVGRHPTRA